MDIVYGNYEKIFVTQYRNISLLVLGFQTFIELNKTHLEIETNQT